MKKLLQLSLICLLALIALPAAACPAPWPLGQVGSLNNPATGYITDISPSGTTWLVKYNGGSLTTIQFGATSGVTFAGPGWTGTKITQLSIAGHSWADGGGGAIWINGIANGVKIEVHGGAFISNGSSWSDGITAIGGVYDNVAGVEKLDFVGIDAGQIKEHRVKVVSTTCSGMQAQLDLDAVGLALMPSEVSQPQWWQQI